ncbi:MOSC domain-containing protein [Jannaschia faecimaris]|uniref:MOSC domain-containing protein n=1 Tax=Jannaschia faecimaris TaxID=1244108 RepID=A0A1H3L9J3_9RHOB|nr:MOSC domain-containing protein [Jannaschia faecimaris]SDY60598.1 MOSC domain-containing protein [Jannaschia faecimaris]
MPALKATLISGHVTWVGVVPARDLTLSSCPRDRLHLTFAGPEGEDHAGLTRPSCLRVTAQYEPGTEIRNTRQLSIVSAEDLEAIRRKVGTEFFDPGWIGATMVVSGIPDLTFLPPSSRLQFEDGATITVDMENRACTLPVQVIEADAPGHGRTFMAAARGRRGVTAWVEREGIVRIGDEVRLHVPDQRTWRGH